MMSRDVERALRAGDVPRVIRRRSWRALAENSWNIDMRDSHGEMALMLANGLPMIQMLVESGADINAKDIDVYVLGQNPLMWAAQERLPQIHSDAIIADCGVAAGTRWCGHFGSLEASSPKICRTPVHECIHHYLRSNQNCSAVICCITGRGIPNLQAIPLFAVL